MNPDEREAQALRDARAMCDNADFIVSQGLAAFLDPEDFRGRLAGKSLVIDLATALHAASEWQSRNAESWRQLKKTRDRFAHFYVTFDFERLWDVLVHRIPGLRETLEPPG